MRLKLVRSLWSRSMASGATSEGRGVDAGALCDTVRQPKRMPSRIALWGLDGLFSITVPAPQTAEYELRPSSVPYLRRADRTI